MNQDRTLLSVKRPDSLDGLSKGTPLVSGPIHQWIVVSGERIPLVGERQYELERVVVIIWTSRELITEIEVSLSELADDRSFLQVPKWPHIRCGAGFEII